MRFVEGIKLSYVGARLPNQYGPVSEELLVVHNNSSCWDSGSVFTNQKMETAGGKERGGEWE